MHQFMKWMLPLICLAAAMMTRPAVSHAQCSDGRCYGPPGVYGPAIYVLPVSPRGDCVAGDTCGEDTEQIVIPCHDPCFSQCNPYGCFRPVFPPRPGCPGWQPNCQQPPCAQSYKRTVGIGLNLSWTSRRSWR